MKMATQHLFREHQKIQSMLKAFERACRLFNAGVSLPREDLEACLDFFKNFVDKVHHAKEEEILLPALMAKRFPLPGGPLCSYFKDLQMMGPSLSDQIEDVEKFLREKGEQRPDQAKQNLPGLESIPVFQEHQLGRKLVQAMRLHVGQSRFLEFATPFIRLLQEHIDKEDRCLFSMCDDYFGDDEQKLLLKKFEETDEKIGTTPEWKAWETKWKNFQERYGSR